MKTLRDGIFKYNPIFGLCLGLCSTLAVSYNVEKSLIMGISVTVILLASNLIISLLKNIIDDAIRVPACIVIIASFVTILELLLQKYAVDVYKTLGIYIPLITVNCIVLGRAISFASKQSVGKSIMDGLGCGLGFTIAICMVGMVRELLGSNSLTIINNLSSLLGFKLVITDIIPGGILPLSVFVSPAGAFITLGLLMALINALRKVRD